MRVAAAKPPQFRFPRLLIGAPRLDNPVCATPGLDPDMWFRHDDEKQAKALCSTCPARVACLAWAIDQTDLAGVWGGMSQDDRAAMASVAA